MPEMEYFNLKTQELAHNKITFCQLTEEEYSSIYYIRMKNQGWLAIADSAESHFALAKNTIYALKHEETIIATLSAAKYPKLSIAYMGFYIVDPNWRGIGLGRYLWENVANLLGKENYIIEFDAPNELLPYYSSLGYEVFSTSTIYVLNDRSKIKLPTQYKQINEVSATILAQVIEYDSSIIPDEHRARFISLWLNKNYTSAVCYLDGANVIGYGVISKHLIKDCDKPYGYLLAPVYAKTPEAAIAIIKALCLRANDDEPIYMDTLNYLPTASTIAKSLGFVEAMPMHRLSASGHLDEAREKIISNIYALSSHGYSPL